MIGIESWMAFRANPLSLSVPEPAFETWLRDTGYLEIVDQRTTTTNSSSSTTSTSATAASATTTTTSIFVSIISHIITLLSLFTLNPFAKVNSDDLSGQTASWTSAFIGSLNSYSFPSSTSQARLRLQENVKRYARNYSSLFVLFFACSLYQMPFALGGLIASLALWDIFKYCGDRWGLDQYPVLRQILIRISQCVTAVILICSNVQMALFCTLGVSYAVMILHASFRNLAPANQPNKKDGNRRR